MEAGSPRRQLREVPITPPAPIFAEENLTVMHNFDLDSKLQHFLPPKGNWDATMEVSFHNLSFFFITFSLVATIRGWVNQLTSTSYVYTPIWYASIVDYGQGKVLYVHLSNSNNLNYNFLPLSLWYKEAQSKPYCSLPSMPANYPIISPSCLF